MPISHLTDYGLLALLAVSAVAVLRLRNLVGVVMFAGIYSLVTAALYADLDAVDVAFTEAVVGAGVSTVLLLVALALTGHTERDRRHRPLLPLLVCLVTGGVLGYGMSGLAPIGDARGPTQLYVAPYYLDNTQREMGMPEVVTAVVAGYRGFDTLGETTVIFTAAVGVFLLIGEPQRRRKTGAGARHKDQP